GHLHLTYRPETGASLIKGLKGRIPGYWLHASSDDTIPAIGRRPVEGLSQARRALAQLVGQHPHVLVKLENLLLLLLSRGPRRKAFQGLDGITQLLGAFRENQGRVVDRLDP